MCITRKQDDISCLRVIHIYVTHTHICITRKQDISHVYIMLALLYTSRRYNMYYISRAYNARLYLYREYHVEEHCIVRVSVV